MFRQADTDIVAPFSSPDSPLYFRYDVSYQALVYYPLYYFRLR